MFRQFPFLHRISSETEGQDHLSGRCLLLISVLSQFMEWKIIERDFNKWENEIEMSSSRWPQLPLITLEVLSRQEENPKPSSRTSSTERSARTRTRRCAESTRTASPCGSWSKAVDRWPNRRKRVHLPQLLSLYVQLAKQTNQVKRSDHSDNVT